MINIYYALQYPDGRFVAIDRDSGMPLGCVHISSAWLLEANEKNLPKMKEYKQMFESDNFKLVVLKINLLPITVS